MSNGGRCPAMPLRLLGAEVIEHAMGSCLASSWSVLYTVLGFGREVGAVMVQTACTSCAIEYAHLVGMGRRSRQKLSCVRLIYMLFDLARPKVNLEASFIELSLGVQPVIRGVGLRRRVFHAACRFAQHGTAPPAIHGRLLLIVFVASIMFIVRVSLILVVMVVLLFVLCLLCLLRAESALAHVPHFLQQSVVPSRACCAPGKMGAFACGGKHCGACRKVCISLRRSSLQVLREPLPEVVDAQRFHAQVLASQSNSR